MAHQIYFYLTPLDFAELEDQLRGKLSFLLAKYENDKPVLTPVPSFQVTQMGKDSLKICLYRPEDGPFVKFTEIPEQCCWIVDSLRSPIIDCIRCYQDESHLSRGRFFYEDGYYDDKEMWVEKPSEFLKWARSIFKNTKKVLTRNLDNGDSYIGRHASRWALGREHKLSPL